MEIKKWGYAISSLSLAAIPRMMQTVQCSLQETRCLEENMTEILGRSKFVMSIIAITCRVPFYPCTLETCVVVQRETADNQIQQGQGLSKHGQLVSKFGK